MRGEAEERQRMCDEQQEVEAEKGKITEKLAKDPPAPTARARATRAVSVQIE